MPTATNPSNALESLLDAFKLGNLTIGTLSLKTDLRRLRQQAWGVAETKLGLAALAGAQSPFPALAAWTGLDKFADLLGHLATVNDHTLAPMEVEHVHPRVAARLNHELGELHTNLLTAFRTVWAALPAPQQEWAPYALHAIGRLKGATRSTWTRSPSRCRQPHTAMLIGPVSLARKSTSPR